MKIKKNNPFVIIIAAVLFVIGLSLIKSGLDDIFKKFDITITVKEK